MSLVHVVCKSQCASVTKALDTVLVHNGSGTVFYVVLVCHGSGTLFYVVLVCHGSGTLFYVVLVHNGSGTLFFTSTSQCYRNL